MSDRWGVYVHVPWCRVQCPYCAFDVTTGPLAPGATEGWTASVLAEHRRRRRAFPSHPPATLAFGGGTPSRVPPAAIAQLVDAVSPSGEVSLEANPEDLDPTWLDAVVEAGVDRVSVGVQSFSLATRKRLGRAWVSAEPERALAPLRDHPRLRSWSIDLIFAVPDQTLDDLDADLDAIERLGPPHVALYGLTFEEGTPLHRAVRSGRMQPPNDDLWRRMYERIGARLQALGLHRYEVSNYARPGHRSQHNELYWHDRPYLGLGPSAHGYLPDGRRYHNVRTLAAYLQHPDPTDAIETPSAEQALLDLLVSCLRSSDGVDRDYVHARTGLRLSDASVRPLVDHGLLAEHGRVLVLTDDGVPVCDAVVAHLVRGTAQ